MDKEPQKNKKISFQSVIVVDLLQGRGRGRVIGVSFPGCFFFSRGTSNKQGTGEDKNNAELGHIETGVLYCCSRCQLVCVCVFCRSHLSGRRLAMEQWQWWMPWEHGKENEGETKGYWEGGSSDRGECFGVLNVQVVGSWEALQDPGRVALSIWTRFASVD